MRDRAALAHDLARFGRRFASLVGAVPTAVGRRTVPSAFGRVPLVWLAALRVYDEWVHQADIGAALDRPEPSVPPDARAILAWFQRRALPADVLPRLAPGSGVVAIEVGDAPGPEWRIDLGTRRFGAHVAATPTVHVALSTATWCLLAADRRSWRDLETDGRILLTGADRPAAEVLLDAIRVV